MNDSSTPQPPLVSVLMTAYNREKYIEEAIESVLASTYQNLELIIVDDCSKDRTVEIASSYAAKDQRVKVYVNEKNLGDYPNRNKAASYAKGKYLKYLDSDDTIYPHGLAVMVEAMEKFPGSALGLSRKVDETKSLPILLSPHESYAEQFFVRGLFGIGPSRTIVLREAFEKEKGFSGERYVGDTELWFRLGAKYPTVKIQPGLIWWREHEEQEYKAGSDSGYYLTQEYSLCLSSIKNKFCPLEPKLRAEALVKLKQRYARQILSLIFKKGKIATARRMYINSDLTLVDLLAGFRRRF